MSDFGHALSHKRENTHTQNSAENRADKNKKHRHNLPSLSLYPRRLDSFQSLGRSWLCLSNRGSILSARLRRDSLCGSAARKKRGASCTSHLGSIAVTSRMYSLDVSTSSWYTTQSGCRWNRDEPG